MSDTTKFLLTEDDLARDWYNIAADLPSPVPPPLHPGTLQPIGPADLAPIFPMEVIKQEVSQDRWIPIPDEVRDAYRLWRPTPLYRALALEEQLSSPPLIARTKYWYARHLTDVGDDAAHEQAGMLLTDVLATTDELGMPALHRQASERLASLGPTASDTRSL